MEPEDMNISNVANTNEDVGDMSVKEDNNNKNNNNNNNTYEKEEQGNDAISEKWKKEEHLPSNISLNYNENILREKENDIDKKKIDIQHINIHSKLEDKLGQHMNEENKIGEKIEKYVTYGEENENFHERATNYFDINISNSDTNEKYNTENEETIGPHKSLKERYFGPLTPGGVRSSTVLFTCTAIGIGMLSIPYVFSKLGILLSMLLIFLNAIESYITTNILCLSCLEHNIFVYGNLLRKIGNSFHKFIIDVSLTLSFFSSYVLTLILISKCLIEIFEILNFPTFLMNPKLLIIVICALIIPLISRKKIGKFSYFLALSLISLTATIITISVQTQFYYNSLPEPKKYIILFNIDSSFFKCFNILLYAFTQQSNACFITGQFHRPTVKRMQKTNCRSLCLQIFFYSFIGILGYISFSDLTQDNIVLNYENSNVSMMVCKIFLSISFFFSTSLNFMGSYQSILSLLLGIKKIFYTILCIIFRRNRNREILLNDLTEDNFDRSETTSTDFAENIESARDTLHDSPQKKIIVFIITSVFAVTVCLNVKHISSLIGIIGGLASTFISCVLPNLMYFKNRHQVKNKLKKYLTLCMLLSYSLVGFISVFVTAYESFAT